MSGGHSLADDSGQGASGAAATSLRALRAARAYAWASEGGAFSCSGAAEELLGRAPGSAEDLDALVHPPDRPLRAAAIATAVESGGPWTAAFRVAADDTRWIEERGEAVRGSEGVSLAAVAFDATLHRRQQATLEELFRRESRARQAAELSTGTAEAAVRALARSEAFLESIFSAMADGLVLFDRGGGVTRANPRAREMLGQGEREPASAIAERLLRVEVRDVEGRVVPTSALPFAAALRGEVVHGVPLRLRLPTGQTMWATVGAAPILAPDGVIVGAVMSLGDVSRLRELQEQREDLSRTISHDLRTPLNVIVAQARLLSRRSEGPEAVRTRADAIARSATQMATMLTDLVESALLEAGKLRLDLAPVDVVALTRDLQRRLAALHGDRIRVEVAGAVAPIVADAARLDRILSNLLTNALKYSPGHAEVVVRVADGIAELTIAVEDRGAGIAPEDLPRIFERWFRARGTERLEGMGLGLYTTRMLVEAHGGSVDAASEAGKGSVFRVRLPRAQP